MNEDIREEIRNLKFFSKRLMHSVIPGDYSAAFKGSGLEFDQLREYRDGDDVRFVDWNASAKTGTLMVKEFVPERDRTVIFTVDCSASGVYSSKELLKRDVMLRVASALAFIANNSNDRVGALLFSDRIEHWFPPRRGEAHMAQIMKGLCDCSGGERSTSLSEALRFLVDLRNRNSILFFISDWVEGGAEQTGDAYTQYERLLKIAACEYDMVAVRVFDLCERELPDVGMIELEDIESGQSVMVDASDPELQNCLAMRHLEQRDLLKRCGADVLDMVVGCDIARVLADFFHYRIGKQV